MDRTRTLASWRFCSNENSIYGKPLHSRRDQTLRLSSFKSSSSVVDVVVAIPLQRMYAPIDRVLSASTTCIREGLLHVHPIPTIMKIWTALRTRWMIFRDSSLFYKVLIIHLYSIINLWVAMQVVIPSIQRCTYKH